MYESMCKITDAAGSEGQRNIEEALKSLDPKNIRLLGGGACVVGMGTLPKTTKIGWIEGKRKRQVLKNSHGVEN